MRLLPTGLSRHGVDVTWMGLTLGGAGDTHPLVSLTPKVSWVRVRGAGLFDVSAARLAPSALLGVFLGCDFRRRTLFCFFWSDMQRCAVSLSVAALFCTNSNATQYLCLNKEQSPHNTLIDAYCR